MMLDKAKHIGDIAATAGAIITTVSQWASIITPIVTLLIALASLAWWIMRWSEKFAGKAQD